MFFYVFSPHFLFSIVICVPRGGNADVAAVAPRVQRVLRHRLRRRVPRHVERLARLVAATAELHRGVARHAANLQGIPGLRRQTKQRNNETKKPSTQHVK